MSHTHHITIVLSILPFRFWTTHERTHRYTQHTQIRTTVARCFWRVDFFFSHSFSLSLSRIVAISTPMKLIYGWYRAQYYLKRAGKESRARLRLPKPNVDALFGSFNWIKITNEHPYQRRNGIVDRFFLSFFTFLFLLSLLLLLLLLVVVFLILSSCSFLCALFKWQGLS